MSEILIWVVQPEVLPLVTWMLGVSFGFAIWGAK